MDEETRKKVIKAWQERKQDEIVHPFIKEKVSLGLVPHIQGIIIGPLLTR